MGRTVPLAALTSLIALAGCQDNETAISRGDRLWADSNFTAATQEYRLAVDQRADQDALARLAHGHARLGELVEAREAYDRLLAISPGYADQAAYDFLRIIDRALQRGDALTVAMALDAALSLRPELQVPGAVRSVARLYRERDDPERAVAYYRRALTSMPADSTPPVLYEIGLLYEELDRCGAAIDYFQAARRQARAASRSWGTLRAESRWQIGSCAFRLARAARTDGRAAEALTHYDAMIALGVPENLLDQAWFDRGEILLDAGRFDDALASYRTVLDRNPTRSGQLVERAQRRIDQIRFGRVPTDSVPQ